MGTWSYRPDGNDCVADLHDELFDKSFFGKIEEAFDSDRYQLWLGAADVLERLNDVGFFGFLIELRLIDKCLDRLESIETEDPDYGWDEEVRDQWVASVFRQVAAMKLIRADRACLESQQGDHQHEGNPRTAL